MRCVACGSKMILVKVVPDDIASGYKRCTLQCSGCYEIEEHLVSNCARRSRLGELSVAFSALSMAYAEADNELDKIETFLKGAIEMVRAPTVRPRRIVRMDYEPHDEAAFAAQDTHTGQVVRKN